MNFRCAVGLMAAWLPAICSSAGLKPETQAAWNQYLQRVEQRGRTGRFLWADQDPLRAARARQGEILAESQIGANPQVAPFGLIHDWAGVVFVPGVTLAQVFAVVHDYGRYSEFYRPTVIDAALLESKSGEDERFRLRYTQKLLFMAEVLDSEYKIRHVQLDARRWYSIAESTRLTEIVAGAAAPGDGESRNVWRIYNISRFEQRDGGVYVEQENIILSRAIPASLRWVLQPAIRQLSRDLIVGSLRQTRDVVGSSVRTVDLGRVVKPTLGGVSP